MSKSTPTFYLFHGDDGIALDDSVQKLRASMGEGPNAELNISELDGDGVSIGEVIAAVSAYPFLADKRLVIVKGLVRRIFGKGSSKKDQTDLLESLPNLPPYARLVLAERESLSEANAVVKLTKEHPNGHHRHFETPKDKTDWIIHRAKAAYSASIEVEAARLLSDFATSLRDADNELEKLASYVDSARPITAQDVMLLTPDASDPPVFDMIDAVIVGQSSRAMKILHDELQKNPRDEGFGLYALLVNQFRRLLLVREHLDSGGSTREIAEKIGLPKNQAWLAEKLARQSRGFSLKRLEEIYRTLQKYDFEMKTGQIPPLVALDLIVAGLSQH